ncbi:MAG: hypothetical protein ABSG41_09310 [Bryobacteraceae bacterium]|jgi:hypothetical protein
MPTTKRNRPAQSLATPITEHPKPVDKQPPALSEFARQVYEQVKVRLEGEFESFEEHSTIEEKRLLIEILNDHMNRSSGGRPRSPGEYEIPLYSAIERQISGRTCVVIDDDHMVPQVEEFIAAMERKSWKRKPYDPSKRDTEDEIRDRFEASFRREVDLFARDAGQPSFLLMKDILARWNELAHDPGAGKLPNVLAVAAEMELDRLRAETAAEEAGKAS